jgi:hypothetical protein
VQRLRAAEEEVGRDGHLPRRAQVHEAVLLVEVRERVGRGERAGGGGGDDFVDEVGEGGGGRERGHGGGVCGVW